MQVVEDLVEDIMHLGLRYRCKVFHCLRDAAILYQPIRLDCGLCGRIRAVRWKVIADK